MCQPRHFIVGNITKRLMRFGNQKMITDSVDRLNVIEGDVVVEVGSGNGQSLNHILKKNQRKYLRLK